MEPEIVSMDLNLNVDGDYERFIRDLRETLADHPQRLDYIAKYDPWLQNHHLLRKQRCPERPARWIYINLTEQDENKGDVRRTTVAVRDDNVYLIGFRNRDGNWYELGTEGSNARFIPGSTFLGYDCDYGALVGGRANLVNLNLGKEAARCAVRTLWAYQHVGPANAATKKDLARLCLMICEAARMVPHYNTVGGGGWRDGSSIDLPQVDYANTWSKMSRALITCAEEDPQNLREHYAFAVVKLLLNSRLPKVSDGPQQHQQEQSPTPGGGGTSQQRPGSDPQLPQTSSSRPPASSSGGGTQQQGRTAGKSIRGRSLVEVCRVVPFNSDVVVDTVVVFDGKRGQIIYKHDDHTESPSQGTSKAPYRYRDLVLTGPYRAISAEGSFVIQVDGIPGTDSSDKSSKVSGDLFWDCYAEDVEYDKLLMTDVINTDTGRRLAKLTYAVWSDAVEATVEVNLLLPAGTTQVYGRITEGWLSSRAVLFSREREEKVELVPSSADSMVPLELSRSVIVVPVHTSHSYLLIRVQLHAATPNDEDDVLLEGVIDFDFDKHTGEIVVRSFGDFFVPVGGTGGFDPTGGISASHGSPGAPTSASHEGTEQTSVQQCKVQVNVTSPGFHISSHNFWGR